MIHLVDEIVIHYRTDYTWAILCACANDLPFTQVAGMNHLRDNDNRFKIIKNSRASAASRLRTVPFVSQ